MNTLIVHGMRGDKSRCIYGNKVIYPQHFESSCEYTFVHGMQGDKSRCIYGNKVIYPQHLESYEYT